jgi:TP901 family phage tail tape measure protein
LQKATSEVLKLNTLKIDLNEAPAIADLNKIETEAKQTGNAIEKGLGGGVDGLKGKLGGLTDGLGGLGGSFQSLTGGVTSLVPGLGSLSGVLASGGITAGIAAIGGGIAYSIEKGKEFETQLASLSSITGVSGAGLQDLGDKAQVMAGKFGTDASANIEAFKTILSKLGPDIAKSPEALNSMAESVNTLSKATGDDPGKSTEALTGALLQFGVSLDDPKNAADAMAVAMNVLAAGAKEGASEVPDVAAAINVAGVAASSAKVSFEETNSAIQILAAGGKVGAEAGTSLRNVLNKLGEGRFLPKDTAAELKNAGVDINKLGDTSITFSERLRELNKISGDAALKTKLFGTDAAAAAILIKGASTSMDGLTEKLTGTNTATEQAAINMATFDEQLNRIKSGVDNFAISFYQGMQMSFGMLAESTGPAIGELMNNIGGYFERLWSVVQPILALIGGAIMLGISNTINIAVGAVNVLYENLIYAFDEVVKAVKPLIDAIKSALGMDGAMGEGIDVVKILQDVMNGFGVAIGIVFDVVAGFGKMIIDVVVAALSILVETTIAVDTAIVDFGKFIGNLILQIPGVTSVFNGLKDAFNVVYNFFANLPETINEVQIYLKAIGFTFQSIFGILKESFDAALNLDFGKAADKLASVFQSQTWVSAFSSNLQKARTELKATSVEVQQTGKKFEEFIGKSETTTPVTAKPKGEAKEQAKTKGEAKEQASALEQLKEFYKDKQEAQKNDIERELADEKNKYADKKVLRAKLEAEANTELRQFLNERIGGISDANAFLDESQLTVKIAPSKAKGETVEDINTFYTQEIVKLRKGLDNEIQFKLLDIPAFKEELKEVDTAIKEYTSTANKLVPIQFTTDPAELAKVQNNVLTFQEFLRAENIRIAQLQKDAQIAGNVEAAQRFGEAIASNIQSINGLESKVKDFALKSQEEQKKNTLEYQVQTALQTSFLDVFNSEKIRKERETNETIRKERLGALDAEENDLNKSLAKREISAEEYAAKLAEINNNRADVESKTNKGTLDRFKEVADATAASVLKSQGDIFKKNAEKMEGNEKIFNEFVGNTLNQFSVLAASGKATLADFGAAAASAAFDAVAAMIPSFVTGILGSSITTLGPILGPLAAASLTGVLYGLLGLARSAAGFKDGVVGLDGAGTETSDSIPAWLSRGESVITARATKNNKEELEFMNRTGLSIAEFYKMRMPSTSVSVTPDGDLIREVRKLREETRGLGVRIQRNTSVEVSGVLTADSKSINALIVEQKRRSARRG